MSQSSTPAVSDAIYDASSLGRPRMFVLGLQHMFAMFGATVLVPVLTGLSVSATLLFAGIGTLLFHFLSRGKVPAFLGSSFAFIAGYAAIAPTVKPSFCLTLVWALPAPVCFIRCSRRSSVRLVPSASCVSSRRW